MINERKVMRLLISEKGYQLDVSNGRVDLSCERYSGTG